MDPLRPVVESGSRSKKYITNIDFELRSFWTFICDIVLKAESQLHNRHPFFSGALPAFVLFASAFILSRQNLGCGLDAGSPACVVFVM